MAEDVIIRYRAEVSQAVADIDRLAKENLDLAKSTEQAAKSVDKTTKSVKNLENEVTDTSKKFQGASKSVTDFSTKTNSTLNQTGGAIKSFAAGAAGALAAAFSVGAVVSFAKASIDAFLQAEKTAERLKFAITTIGGQSEVVFERLIRQSAELQKTTIFSDDSIQSAQAALAAFGLTGREIEKLIPQLANFATVTGQDITQAAQQVGAGLEGAGREFKKYGIEVSATASRQENLNNIMSGFATFTGAAEQGTKTLSGQLEVLTNQADELQESIGADLAPTFVKLKVALFDATKAAIDWVKASGNIFDFTVGRELDKLPTAVEQIAKKIDEGTQVLVKGGKDEREAREETIITIYKEIKAREALLLAEKRRLELSRESADMDDEERANAIKRVEIRLGGILNEKKAIADEANALDDLFKVSKNVADEQKKDSDKRVASSAQEINQLEKITDTSLNNLEKIYIESLKGIQSFRTAVKEEQQKSNKETVDEFEKTLDELNDARLKATNQTSIAGLPTLPEFPIAEFIEQNEEIISASQNLVNSLSELYNQLAQNQIDSINRAKDAQIESLNVQLEANDEALSKRRISAVEAEAVEKRLLAEQVKAEAEADKKIREIKRKQAIADKAAALVEIAINTAKAISSAIGPQGIVLIPLYAALGAAQAALVAAQPIPYEKGTKAAKGGLSLVDEKGQEAIGRTKGGRITTLEKGDKVVPVAPTNRYGEVLDAMFDNRFDAYVLTRYVNPALQKQKAEIESKRSNSFAQNIGKSIVYNQLSAKNDPALKTMLKNGIPLTNADEIGQSVARHLQQDIYRTR